MRERYSLFAVLVILAATSCSVKEIPPPKWAYEQEAIRLNLEADFMLNQDQGKAHTLYMCIYQLSDPNVFNQLTDDQAGLSQLLGCQLFDATVAASKRVIIHPGEKLTMKIDRAENARYVALVTGYYGLDKRRITRLVEIPVVIERKGFFRRSAVKRPGVLELHLMLGPEQILAIDGKEADE